MFPKSNKKTGSYADVSRLWFDCCKRDIVDDPLIQTALQQLRINPADHSCLKLVHEKINAVDVRETLNPEPFRKTNPGEKSNISGSIRLGVVKHTGAVWGIESNMLTVHKILLGRTGGGKTTIIKKIIRQLLEEKNSDYDL